MLHHLQIGMSLCGRRNSLQLVPSLRSIDPADLGHSIGLAHMGLGRCSIGSAMINKLDWSSECEKAQAV